MQGHHGSAPLELGLGQQEFMLGKLQVVVTTEAVVTRVRMPSDETRRSGVIALADR